MKPKILTTIRDYSPWLLAADTLAGAKVALVALPLSIAIAIASGALPVTGLPTVVVAGFLIFLLGGSRVQIGVPAGAGPSLGADSDEILCAIGYDADKIAKRRASGVV